MADLFRFQDRVHRHEDPASSGGSKNCDYGLELFGQIDGDAFVAHDRQAAQSGCDSIHLFGEFTISERLLPEQQRGGIRCTLSGVENQFVE